MVSANHDIPMIADSGMGGVFFFLLAGPEILRF